MNRLYIIILIITLFIIGCFVYNKFAFFHIIVSFDEMEPFEKKLPVYYKGFKVGRTAKIFPDKHYKNTFVKLKLYPADVELPSNIFAVVQKDYINLAAPEEASVVLLKEGDIIEGKLSKDLNKMLTDKLSSGSLDSIIDDTTTLLESANVTVRNLGEIFAQINGILLEIRGDIVTASSNVAKTTVNLENMSSNLNSALKKESLVDSVGNIEQTTANIKEISSDLNEITNQVDKVTMPIINSVLCKTNSSVSDVNDITFGLKNTLRKRMGLGRILFGRPITDECKY